MIAYTTTIIGNEVVTLEELQNYIRVFDPNEDAFLTQIRDTAESFVERYIERAVRLQTVVAYFDRLDAVTELPFGNANSITSVTYTDSGGTQQTLDPSGYRLLVGTPQRVAIDPVPEQKTNYKQGAVITYEAGLDASITGAGKKFNLCESKYRQAVLVVAADMYENRETQIVGATVAENATAIRLMNQMREFGL